MLLSTLFKMVNLLLPWFTCKFILTSNLLSWMCLEIGLFKKLVNFFEANLSFRNYQQCFNSRNTVATYANDTSINSYIFFSFQNNPIHTFCAYSGSACGPPQLRTAIVEWINSDANTGLVKFYDITNKSNIYSNDSKLQKSICADSLGTQLPT